MTDMHIDPILKVKLELAPGTTISKAFVYADLFATHIRRPVAFEFNGKEEVFEPSEHAAVRVERWYLESIGRREREEEARIRAQREAAKPRFELMPNGAVQPVPSMADRS